MKFRKLVAMMFISLYCMFSFSGCFPPSKKLNKSDLTLPEPPKIEVKVDEKSQEISKLNDSISAKAQDIKSSSVSIQENVVDANKINKVPEVTAKLNTIDVKAKSIQKNSEQIIENTQEMKVPISQLVKAQVQIESLQKYVKDATAQIKELSKTNSEYVDQIQKYENDAKAKNQRIWMFVISICALLLIAGVLISIYVNPKTGIPLIVAAITCSSIAYFMAQYAWIIGLIGGLFFLGIIVYAIYYIYVHKKALVESITSLELLKNAKGEWNTIKQNVKNIQSPTTQKIVSSIKYDERIGK